jgi:hypothetical protein
MALSNLCWWGNPFALARRRWIHISFRKIFQNPHAVRRGELVHLEAPQVHVFLESGVG